MGGAMYLVPRGKVLALLQAGDAALRSGDA
jgi:hypothetical protein